MLSRTFRYSFKKGLPKKVIYTPYFILRYEKSQDNGKYAVVVGKKVDKRSTVRNALKRRFLDTFQNSVPYKEISCNIVFYLKKATLAKSNEELDKIIQEAINSIRVS